MKIRYALALAALLPILAACKADGSTNTTAAPAEPAAAPAATTEPAAARRRAAKAPRRLPLKAKAPAEAAPATAPAPTTAALTGPAPVEGADYQVIPNGQPFQPATGKIEVTEIFGYVCPACAAFQPLVGPWKPACRAT